VDHHRHGGVVAVDIFLVQDCSCMNDMKLAIAILITWIIGLGFVLAAVVWLATHHH
jgi:hypothetical protein